MIVRLFDPEGVNPRDYRAKYKELDEYVEFDDLSSKELIFVWYFANLTSPLLDIKDRTEKAKQALKEAQWDPPHSDKEKITNGVFSEKLSKAIDRMSKFEPGPRYLAYKSIQRVFAWYEEILEAGEEPFQKEIRDKEGNVTTSVDLKNMVSTITDITKEYPRLIEQLESGFGIKEKAGTFDTSELKALHRDWNIGKYHNK